MANSLVKLTLESNQYERNLRNAHKQWNDFMKGMGVSVQKFTAVSAAVAGVTGALKVAKEAFFANEKQLDEWNRTVEASKSVYNGFLSALNTGDIGGFLSNIDQIVNAAKNAYNALDELQTFQAYNQVQDARSRANYAKALDAYKLSPTSENKAALSAANQAVIENIKQEQEFTKTAYTEALNKLANERGLKGKNRQDFIDMFQNKSYNEMLTIKNKYDEGKAGKQLYYGDRVLGGKIQNRDTGVWREMDENEIKEFEFARALNQLNDEQIKATQALGKQAEMLDEAIWQQDRAYNRLAGNNASGKTTGGGGGGGRSGGGGTKTELTEMQSLQKQIRELEQEYIRLGGITTEEANKRKSEIQTEISARERQINQLKLYEENAHGRLLGGGIQTPVEANVSSSIIPTIDQIREQIAKNPIIIPIQATQKDIKAIGESAKIAASMVGTIGQAFNAIEDPAAKVMGTVAQAVATVALAYADTLAKDQSSKSNIWAFIAAAAASTVSMIATIASIHQATGYAHGGEIKGNTYSNDQIPIMANAGEVVLTRAMQGNLASQLNAQSSGGGYMPSHISGEQIYIALNRYVRRSGRGEIVTWKS